MALLADEVRRMYREADDVLEKQIVRDQHVSCRKGCAHCCQLLALTTLPEAYLLAQWVARSPDSEVWVSRLLAVAREVATCTDRGDWFDRRIPCLFLAADNTCRVYDDRPGCCRWLAVRTPPELCAPEARRETVERYDTRGLERYAIECAIRFHDERPEAGAVGVGLIPLAVLWALHIGLRGKARRRLEKKMFGLPTLAEWTARYRDEPVNRTPAFRVLNDGA